MKQSKNFYLIILAAGFFCLGGLFAMDVSDAFAADKNPCSGDIARFCPGIEPGPAGMNALMECLEKYEKELICDISDEKKDHHGLHKVLQELIILLKKIS